MHISITNLPNLRHQEPGTIFQGTSSSRQDFPKFYNFFQLILLLFPIFTMAKESILLDCYTFLQDKYFIDQLHQTVGII